jgi:hypothetical protein
LTDARAGQEGPPSADEVCPCPTSRRRIGYRIGSVTESLLFESGKPPTKIPTSAATFEARLAHRSTQVEDVLRDKTRRRLIASSVGWLGINDRSQQILLLKFENSLHALIDPPGARNELPECRARVI